MVLKIEGLTKDFKAVRALDDLDLSVGPGEVFGYLGPNGAGKTTTIRLILDLLRPTSGSVEVLGGSGRSIDIRNRIGYLPADLSIDPNYTANDVIAFYSALRGRIDQQLTDSILERFEVEQNRPMRELSTGNRRKVGIVQAFMHRPELLILDEPTSGLDPLLQQQFHQLVKEVVAEGATVFLSSHVLHEVEQLAGRVGVLRKGRLIRTVTIEELRRTARQRIELEVDGDADAGVFAGVPGVVEAIVQGNVIHLVLQGSADPVIKAAAQFAVHRIVARDIDLDDMFMDLYEGGEQ